MSFREVKGRFGSVRYFGKDEYVGRSVHNYGEYNPDEVEMVISLASGRGLALDIGANIGCISQGLIASGCDVVAFEPQPEVFKLLQYNMENAFGTAFRRAYNVALGSEAGTAKMPKVYYSDKGNFGGLGLGESSIYGSYDVPVVTIDSFELDIGFLKMDVEGFEYEALLGAANTIARCRPIMYIEDDRPAKSARLRAHITALGYTIEEHHPPLYRKLNHFGLQKNIWDKNYVSHNLICRPC